MKCKKFVKLFCFFLFLTHHKNGGKKNLEGGQEGACRKLVGDPLRLRRRLSQPLPPGLRERVLVRAGRQDLHQEEQAPVQAGEHLQKGVEEDVQDPNEARGDHHRKDEGGKGGGGRQAADRRAGDRERQGGDLPGGQEHHADVRGVLRSRRRSGLFVTTLCYYFVLLLSF